MNSSRWDIVIDAQGLFRSGISAFFARNHGNAYGFSDAREGAPWFYNTSVSVPDHITHAVDRNIYLLNQAMDWDEVYVAPSFNADPEAEAEINTLLPDENTAILSICIGSRWPSKNWPPDFFAKIIDALHVQAPTVTVVLVGSPDDQSIGAKIERSTSAPGLVNTIGKTTLAGLVELLKRSQLLLTNDSGPMHIAAAIETPTVSLFGPTSPERCGPYGRMHRVFVSQAECQACYNRVCPLPEQICYRDTFDVDDVTEAVLELLLEKGENHD